MKRAFALLGIIAVAVLFSAEAVVAQTPPEDEQTVAATVTRGGQQVQTRVLRQVPNPDGPGMVVPGNILVTFRSSASAAQRSNAHAAAAAQSVKALAPDIVLVRVPHARLTAALAAYRGRPEVLAAEPDVIRQISITPNDPFLSLQWGLTKINAPAAWDVSTSNSGVRIAILDCGILTASSDWGDDHGFPNGHPDVNPKIVGEVNFTMSPNGADDWCNHGTHVAGIAAAVTNNAIGVAGAGFNASLVNLKVCGDMGSCAGSDIIQGINYASGCADSEGDIINPCVSRRADIINMSLGGPGACPEAYQTAINTAWSRGLVIVAAAGNGGMDGIGDSGAESPGNCLNVIGVAASTETDLKASFSNFGSGVDVAAPGVNIYASNFVGGYEYKSGTSMATPFVAGLAALVWTTPYNTSNTALVNRIFDTANESACVTNCSVNGRIDAAAAVAPPPDVTPPAAPTFTGTNPVSPANENNPEILGVAEAGSTVRLYTNNDCTSAIAATGSAATFAAPGLTVAVGDNTATTFYATATDAATNTSLCSPTSVTYTEVTDLTPPLAPTFTGTDPVSPANENNPEIIGAAEASSTVRLYTNNDCTSAVAATGSAAAFAAPGLTVTVGDNTATTFYATATDAATNTSPCSPTSITYTEVTDLTPPLAPTFTGTSPGSPGNDLNPEIIGTAEAGSTVQLYTDGDCSSAVAATGSAADFAAPGLTVTVGDGTTTTFYATATDAATNVSPCSGTFITYVELPPVVASTGFLGPSANAPMAPPGDGDGFEINATNALSDDGVFAADMDSGTSTSNLCGDIGKDKHNFTNFGISVPGDATITGVQVRLDAYVDISPGTPRICAQVSNNGGVTWSAWKSMADLGTTEATYILGGPNDTWGRSWTPGNLGNTSFRVRVASVAGSLLRDFYLDWVAVNVTYTTP